MIALEREPVHLTFSPLAHRHHRLHTREAIKTFSSVVSAVAARPVAAKGAGRISDIADDVVDRAASTGETLRRPACPVRGRPSTRSRSAETEKHWRLVSHPPRSERRPRRLRARRSLRAGGGTLSGTPVRTKGVILPPTVSGTMKLCAVAHRVLDLFQQAAAGRIPSAPVRYRCRPSCRCGALQRAPGKREKLIEDRLLDVDSLCSDAHLPRV